MWDFDIALSIRLMLRTTPFLALHLIVNLIWGAILLAAAFAGFAAVTTVMDPRWQGAGDFGPKSWLAIVIATIAVVGLVLLVLRWLRRWALYRVKAAHVAVLVEFVQGRELPEGVGQLRYGRNAVQANIGDAVAFFVLDEIIRAALGGMNRITKYLTGHLPAQSAATINVSIGLLFHFAFNFADEMMLAHTINAQSQDPHATARRGLSIFDVSRPVILKNAFWLSVIGLGLGSLFYFGVLAPVWTDFQAAKTPDNLRTLILATAAGIALLAAFLGPFGMICMLQVWFGEVLGEIPVRRYRRYRVEDAAAGQVGTGPRNGDIV